jgi:hypothetical protein
VLLLFAGIELAIAARDMCTKAVGLIAAGIVAKAPGTGGAERSNGATMRWSSGRARREVDTRRSKAAGECHELELRSNRLSRCGNGGDGNWIDRTTKNGAHVYLL